MNERYRLVRPLASGGMAALFLGISRGAEGFEKPVAIKRILPYLAKDEGVARMFLSEARLATYLQHQNLVSVYDVGSDTDGLFLVMELVNGWDLGALLRRAKKQGARFPPHLVAFIGAQALAGLSHAYRRTHQGRLVLTAHRDISPSNILVSREGEVKVTDFGIARLEGVSHGTQPGIFKGKPSYTAPEVISGEPATAASDQFSLGIVLYELLTGQHPFSDSSEAIIVAMAIAQREPPPLTEVPEPMAEIVMRALAKRPEARFAQPEAMAEALARYLARAGEPATSHTLAAFLTQLNLPPTLLEQAEPLRAPEPGPAPPPPPPLPALRGVEPASEWELPPGSAELSVSGRLVPPASAPSVPDTLPGANAASAVAVEPAPVPSAPPAAAVGASKDSLPPASPSPFRCVRCDAPLLSAYAPCDACATAFSLHQPAPLAAAPGVLEAPAEQLELETREPPAETLWQPKRRGPWVRWALRLGLLAVLAAGGVLAWPALQPLLPKAQRVVRDTLATSSAELPSLIIRSQPEGARVLVDGVDKGTTPLVMDNSYPPGVDIPVQVSLPGYKPWKGTLTGGAPAQFEIRLYKR